MVLTWQHCLQGTLLNVGSEHCISHGFFTSVMRLDQVILDVLPARGSQLVVILPRGHLAVSTTGVQPTAQEPPAAQDGYECSPTQNPKFT